MHQHQLKTKFEHIFIVSSIILFGTMMPLSSLCQPSELPGPKTLLESWQQLDRDLPTSLRSYRMEGKIMPPPASLKTWDAINSGNRFLWLFNADNGEHKMANNDQGFDIYSKFPDKIGLGIHSQNKVETINNYLKFVYAYRVPFRIEDLIRYPNLTFSADVYRSQMPLADYYLTILDKLRTIGAERINGRLCYHVQILPDYQLKIPFIPRDIWFAKIEDRYVPVQFFVYDASGTTRVTLTFTKGQSIGKTWIPTEYRMSTDLRGTMPSGEKNWAHLVSDTVCTLQLSEINRDFPDDTFMVTFPKGTEIVVNSENLGISTTPQTFGRSLFSGYAFRFLVVLGSLLLIFIFWMVRGKSHRRK